MTRLRVDGNAPALLLLTTLLTAGVGSCGGHAASGVGVGPSTDLGPMAPAAEGRPLSTGIDGIELGMTAVEVAAAWGEPLSDSYGTLQYSHRAGYESIEVATVRRDHGDVAYSISLRPEGEQEKEQTLPELIERFGPPVTDAEQAVMIRTAAVDIGESQTLFRAGRYAYAVADWDHLAEDRLLLSRLQLELHPQALLDVPRSQWSQLRYPFPMSLPDDARAQLKALLQGEGPDDATAKEIEALLGPPAWKHPGSLDRDAWRYIFWDSMTDIEVYFTDGVLNGYQTQGLD